MNDDSYPPLWFIALVAIVTLIIVYGCVTATAPTKSETWQEDWVELAMPPGSTEQCYLTDKGSQLYCIAQ